MNLAKKLLGFWFIILSACFGAWILLFNQEMIYVELRGFGGGFKVMSAVAFLICYFLGVTTVTLYFLVDVMKKTFEIRRLHKRLRLLEGDLERERVSQSRFTGNSNANQGSKELGSSKSVPASASMGPRSASEKFPPDGELF